MALFLSRDLMRVQHDVIEGPPRPCHANLSRTACIRMTEELHLNNMDNMG